MTDPAIMQRAATRIENVINGQTTKGERYFTVKIPLLQGALTYFYNAT